MLLTPVETAVLNNVCWYEAMFEAHGIGYQTDDVAWQSQETPPPFHSNLVIRARDARQADIAARMQRIASIPRLHGTGLKDSYASLDLATQGYRTLFNAHWLWLPHTATAATDWNRPLEWDRVVTPTALAEWEAAWADAPVNHVAEARPRQFPDIMLRDRRIAFLAGRQEGRTVAGGIVNLSPGAAGISNFFTRTGLPCNIWPALSRLAREIFPGLPLTGYARGEELENALWAGFSTVGELRVLYRPTEPWTDRA